MDNEKFGAFVAQQRRALGLTQKGLARQLHLTDKAVSKWERGLSFPDIAVLEPLAEALKVTVAELLRGRSQAQTELPGQEELQSAVTETLRRSREEIFLRRRRHLRALWATAALGLLLCFFSAFAVWRSCAAPYPEPFALLPVPCSWTEGETEQWREALPDHSAYDLGLNNQGRPVFQRPFAALALAGAECGDAVAYLKAACGLPPLSRWTWRSYKNYAWQLGEAEPRVQRQGQLLTKILDLYENSFE